LITIAWPDYTTEAWFYYYIIVFNIEFESIKILLFLYEELEFKKAQFEEICGKGDLNSRTPTRMDSKSTAYSQPSIKLSIAFDQTWQFPQKNADKLLYYFIKIQ